MKLFLFIMLILFLLLAKFAIWPVMKVMFSTIGSSFKKGATEAEEYLREKSYDGNVPMEAQLNAYTYLRGQGFSDDKASNFVMGICMQIDQDARNSHRRAYRAKERINDLTLVEHWLLTHGDPVGAAEVEFDIEQEKKKLQD